MKRKQEGKAEDTKTSCIAEPRMTPQWPQDFNDARGHSISRSAKARD
jgi:hypothetical protein